MAKDQRYFFRKKDKLKSRKAIEAVFKTGKHFYQFPFRISWLPENEHAVLQVGVGVSTRLFKRAVDRNKIKRLMREAWRLQKNSLTASLKSNNKNLSVFIIFNGKEIPEYQLVTEKMEHVIRKLKKLMDDQS